MKRRLVWMIVLALALALVWSVTAQAACNHQYQNATKLDNKYHTLTCKICGKVIKQRHGAPCTEPSGTCDVCGATGVNTEQHHTDLEYKTDTLRHTQVCADCGKILLGPEFHTVNGYGTCIVCGETGLQQKVTKLTVKESTKGVKLLLGTGLLPTYTLTTKVEPANAADKTLNYVSSDIKVAKVSGGVITGIGEGTCTITVSTADGSGHSVTVPVVVSEKMVEKITVTPEKADMQLGDELLLAALVEPADAADTSFEWESSKESVAEVDEYGLVTAVGVGKCKIRAVALDGSGVIGECTIKVTSGQVTSITLNKYSKTMVMKKDEKVTWQIIPTVYPADAADQSLLYSTSDPTVATVNDIGLVTAVGPGTCTIRVTAGDGYGAKAEMKITVKEILITTVQLSENSLKLYVTKDGAMPTAQLSATISPASVTDDDLVWSSSDENVATVDEYGLVTAVGYGTCKITCKATDGGGAFDTCKVTVTFKGTTQLNLNLNKVTLYLTDGVAATAQLVPIFVPADNPNQEVSYKSNNTNVATVNKKGLITGISPGTCKITVKAKDGSGAKAYCYVTVTSSIVESIKLNVKKKTLEMTVSNPFPTYQLRAKVDPPEAEYTLEWVSSDDKVATVTDTGLVTAVGPGVCTITARTEEDGVSASMTLTVKKPNIAQVKLNITEKVIAYDPAKVQTFLLKAKVTPTDAYNKQIIWETSTPSVATVSGGLVTIQGVGKCTITARTVDNSAIEARCAVTVIYKPIKTLTISPTKKELVLKYMETVTFQLKTKISPKDAGEQTIEWSSSNPKVAKVDDFGMVTAVAPGTCTITASSIDGSGKKATCIITVKAILVKTITVKKTNIVMEVGEESETFYLNAKVSPKNASNPELEYTSSDPSVASVNEDGVIHAISYGKCVITVSATDGSGKFVNITVTVK